jgi:hypothetical protein
MRRPRWLRGGTDDVVGRQAEVLEDARRLQHQPRRPGQLDQHELGAGVLTALMVTEQHSYARRVQEGDGTEVEHHRPTENLDGFVEHPRRSGIDLAPNDEHARARRSNGQIHPGPLSLESVEGGRWLYSPVPTTTMVVPAAPHHSECQRTPSDRV